MSLNLQHKLNLAHRYPMVYSPSACAIAQNNASCTIPKETENLGIGQGGSTIFSSCTRDSVREHGPSEGRKKRGKADAVQNQGFSFLGYKNHTAEEASLEEVSLLGSNAICKSNVYATAISATLVSIASGGSGPASVVFGLACGVAHIALAVINPHHEEKPWFPLNKKSFTDVKENWKKLFWQTHFEYLVAIAGASALIWLSSEYLDKTALPPRRTWIETVYACVIAPITEEIFFRGFLLEKMRDIQACVLGKKADDDVHVKVRRVVQAIYFGAAHYDSSDPFVNVWKVIDASRFGLSRAEEKESYSHLFCSSAQHCYHNSFINLVDGFANAYDGLFRNIPKEA